jgi:hypothetical protein
MNTKQGVKKHGRDPAGGLYHTEVTVEEKKKRRKAILDL